MKRFLLVASLAIFSLFSFGQACDHYFELTDSYGDGWQGAEFYVNQGGVNIDSFGASITPFNSGPGTGTLTVVDTLSMSAGTTYIIVKATDTWPGEVSFEVFDQWNTTALGGMATMSNTVGDTVATITGNCTAPACVAPTGLAASSITSTGATLSWTAASPMPAVGYEYVVTTTAGTPVAPGTPEPSTSAMVSSLLPNTTYYAYVRSDCGGTQSTWISTTFTTPCAAITTFPYTENFDAATTIPSCWMQDGTNTEDWRFAGSTTYGAASDNTSGSGNIAYIDDSSPHNASPSGLLSPSFDLTSLVSPRLVFYYVNRRTINTADSSKFFVDVYNGSTWTNGVDSVVNQVNVWTRYEIDLTSYSSTSTQIRFRVVESPTGFQSDPSLDDVVVEETPACESPLSLSSANIGATTADISWSAPSSAPANGYEYFTSTTRGTPMGSGTNVPSGTSATLMGLTPLAMNYYYVRSDCGGTFSSWVEDSVLTLATCLEPSQLTSSAITGTGATVSWNRSVSSPANGYEYVVSTTRGIPTTPGINVPIDSFVSVAGLSSLTKHYSYVRSDCGGGDWSVWVEDSFTTDVAPLVCSAGNPAPLVSEDFDNGTTVARWVPSGWSNSKTTTNTGFGWSSDYNATTSGSTGPTGPYSSTGYLYLETSSGVAGDQDTLTSPSVDLSTVSAGGEARFQFRYHMYGATIANLKWGVDDGTSLTLLDSLSGEQHTSSADPWSVVAVDLTPYVGSTVNIVFIGERGSSFTGDISLDAFLVEGCVGCLPPVSPALTNVTASGVDFSWTAPSVAPAGYEYSVSTTAGIPAIGTPTANTMESIGSLSDNTTYYAYVRSDCGAAQSNWVYAGEFTTSCLPFGDFCEGMETSTVGNTTTPTAPDCWTNVDASPNGYAYVRAFGANTGSNCLYLYNSSSNTAGDYLGYASPDLSNLTTGVNNRLVLNVDGGVGYELVVGTMSDVTNASTFVPFDTITMSSTIYEEHTVDFSTWVNPGGHTNIAFMHGLGGTFRGIYVDDICWEPIPTCERPASIVSIDAITTMGATATWSQSTTTASLGYQYEVVASGGTPGTGASVATGTTSTAVDTSASFVGLSSQTTYDFYIRAVCSMGDTSSWEGPLDFTTLCSAIPLATFNSEGEFGSGSMPSTCWDASVCCGSTSANASWKFTGNPGYQLSGLVDNTASLTNQFAWVDGSTPAVAGDPLVLTSPLVSQADVNAMTNPTLCYYVASDYGTSTIASTVYNATQANHNSLTTEVSMDGGTTFDTLRVMRASLDNQNWTKFCFELDKANLAGDVQLRVSVDKVGSTTFYNDIAIDDISITDETCASSITGIISNDTFADCECTDLMGWTSYSNNDELMLSIEQNDDPTLSVVPTMVSIGNTSVADAINMKPTAPYVQPDVDFFIVMSRYWDVNLGGDATRQPTNEISVRSYYTTADYNAVSDSVALQDSSAGALGTHTDLVFYKVNNDKDADPANGHSTVLATDYQEYANGATATDSTWVYTTYGSDHQAETKISTFSGGGGGGGNGIGGGAVPVELIYFDAYATNGADAQLEWATASELNNDRFEIYRSYDGVNFEYVNTVAGNGTTSEVIKYSLLDVNAARGGEVVFYQIKQIDYDGTFEYTEIRKVNFSGEETLNNKISVYPNPFAGHFVVALDMETTSSVSLQVLDLQGKVLQTEILEHSGDRSNTVVNTGDLPVGVYFIKVVADGVSKTQRLVKFK